MKLFTSVTLALLLSAAFPASADLVTEASKAQQASAQHNQVRETAFGDTEQALAGKLAELRAQRDALQVETETLSAAFSDNEKALAALEESLRLETGSLGEVFGVVRQAGNELLNERRNAPASIDQADYDAALAAVADAEALPSLVTLEALWQGLSAEVKKSGDIATETVNVRDADGVVSEQTVTRLGNLGLVNERGYLQWDSAAQQANPLPASDSAILTSTQLETLPAGSLITLDPTRGEVLKQLAQTPTLVDRFEQSGIVGKLIAALMLAGLGIAAVRGVAMARARIAIKAQIKNAQEPGDNPLGRILNVYRLEPDRSLDTLELRLMEAIMDEQQHFERGLSMLKLLAALAPMLGLLGTVTGMIETFQVITQYGNGDPAVMAGGISMALITTVMGLVAAIPLLLAHNVLSSQADTLRGLLEKVGVGLVAQQSEAASADRSVVKLA